MSIVPLSKVTLYGHVAEKERILEDLQRLGCLHLIPLGPDRETPSPQGPASRSREALRFLTGCRFRRRQVTDASAFDAEALEARAIELKDRIQSLENERDFLVERIANLRPWGNFVFPPPGELDHLRLWFYIVPHREMKRVEATGLIWQEAFRDNRFSYLAVVSPSEPEGVPVPRVRTGGKSMSQLEERLDQVEMELEDLQAERASLTRWCNLFEGSIHRLEDRAAIMEAARLTRDDRPVFALRAWAPEEVVPRLEQCARESGLALEWSDPDLTETPPTLMRNPAPIASGQDLVSFYTTPKYWLWDPSAALFISFAVFFSMILGDAGYAAVLGLVTAALWRRMGRSETGFRFRILMAALVCLGSIYGVMIGSYFGVSPPARSFFAGLRILDVMDFHTMMRLSILMGVFHLALANVVTAWHGRRSLRAVAPAAWVFIFAGGAALWLASTGDGGMDTMKGVGIASMGAGGAAVLLFSRTEGPTWVRLLHGLRGLTRLSGAFGDCLSYLRLFALGLASASLAATFNDLAGQVRSSLPGIGLLVAILILLVGHGLNFILAVSSGVIHGLRLNFIEFFNWSISEEGPPFKAFARKERRSWRT